MVEKTEAREVSHVAHCADNELGEGGARAIGEGLRGLSQLQHLDLGSKRESHGSHTHRERRERGGQVAQARDSNAHTRHHRETGSDRERGV